MGKHDTDQTIRDMERLASLLDDRFRVPGTSLRFGLDSLLGLIPGVGDTLSGAVAFYTIYRACKLGVPRSLLLV